MAEFTPITTQEEFDKAIGDRLKRERETVKKEYADYLSPDDVQKKYEGYLSPDDVKKEYEGYLSPEEAAEKDVSEKIPAGTRIRHSAPCRHPCVSEIL